MSSIRTLAAPVALPALAALTALLLVTFGAGPVSAAPSQVLLGTADSFAVLAGSTVTSTGPTSIGGDVGVSPGTAVTGLLAAQVSGTIHAADGVANSAQADLTTAYNNAAGQASTSNQTGQNLGGKTLTPGVSRTPRR